MSFTILFSLTFIFIFILYTIRWLESRRVNTSLKLSRSSKPTIDAEETLDFCSPEPDTSVHESDGSNVLRNVLIGVALTAIIGVVLLNTVVEPEVTVTKQVKPARHSAGLKGPPPRLPAIDPLIRVVVSDDSLDLSTEELRSCEKEYALIVNAAVYCLDRDDPKLQGLLLTLGVYRNDDNDIPRLPDPETSVPLQSPVQQQGFIFAQATKNATQIQTTVPRPFKDRYAEFFYFLALLGGVLGKFYWDHYENKKAGNPTELDLHVVGLSCILSMLVYYSVQQGLENEAGKLSIRGVLFAFNNGFFWQTILRPSKGAGATHRPARTKAATRLP